MVSKTDVRLSQLSFSYGRTPVLSEISLTASAGEFLAIVGPNGCGKSTALKLVAGLYRPASGAVYIGDTPVTGLSRKQLAHQVALLTQAGTAPVNMTVRDLIGMGRFAHQSLLSRRSREDEAKIAEAMFAMDVQSLHDRRVGELSGGQLQRCRMAMTLAQDSSVLLLDEPTTYLDLKYQYGILEKARDQARRGKTVIAVLHDFTQAALYADRVAVFHQGRLHGIGKPDEVLTTETVREVFDVATFAVQSHGITIHLPEQARV